jgi:hypothetical protein
LGLNLIASFQAAFFFNHTQGAALGCCNFEPFGLTQMSKLQAVGINPRYIVKAH